MSWTDLYIARSVVTTTVDEATGVTSGYGKNSELIYDSTDKDGNGIFESKNVYIDDSRQEMTYDNDNGLLLTKSNYNKDGLYETYSYEYNDKGELIKEYKDCNADGTIDYTTDYRGFLEKTGDFFKDLFN